MSLKATKKCSSQILVLGFKRRQIWKRCRLFAVESYLTLSEYNSLTAENQRLQDILPENTHLGLSLSIGMNPFGQVFWNLCLFEVDVAGLKSTDSFRFCFCTCLLFGSLTFLLFGQLFDLVFLFFPEC